MTDPTDFIYNRILTLVPSFPGLEVYQERPDVIESFPTITFTLADNHPDYDLDKTIGRENVVATIDIWADTSSESGALLVALEAAMREVNYLLSFSSRILDPDGISHITTQFIY